MDELDYNKITANVISNLATSAGKTVLEKITQKCKDSLNKGEIDFRIAFEKYLTESEKNISMAKTILYGQTPHHLYSFFERINIKNGRKRVDTSNVNNILSIGHKIIITGTGGIGKSMLMKHCFLNAISNTQLIPVLIELRGLNEIPKDNISIEDYVYDTLCIFGFKLEKEYFKYSLETGCYLVLFDGYDEVKNSLSSKVTKEIIDFSNKYPENYVIVSSRPLEEFVGWSDFTECSSLSLNKQQALSLISKLDYDEELKQKFYKQLEEELYDKYESFASNPLLLTIMLMTFEERISIPDNKTDFYEQAFSTLFHRHDATKKGKYKREITSGLGYEDFKKVFSYFCFRSFFKNQYEFNEKIAIENITRAKEKTYLYDDFSEINYLNDMVKAVCVLVHEGLNYRFSHRSFQEYFAAVYTTQLSDEEQKRFVTSWLKSSAGRLTTDYLDILCELQPDRFMKNILYEPVCNICKEYNKNNKSKSWLVERIFSGVRIRLTNEGKTKIALRIENSYENTILSHMSDYLHYCYENDVRYTEQDEEYIEVTRELKAKYGENRFVSFEELRNDEMYDKALKSIKWFFNRVEHIFNSLDDIEKNTFGRKTKFESMLDEL